MTMGADLAGYGLAVILFLAFAGMLLLDQWTWTRRNLEMARACGMAPALKRPPRRWRFYCGQQDYSTRFQQRVIGLAYHPAARPDGYCSNFLMLRWGWRGCAANFRPAIDSAAWTGLPTDPHDIMAVEPFAELGWNWRH